jgi:FtsZ-interacting cell division protein ZipA
MKTIGYYLNLIWMPKNSTMARFFRSDQSSKMKFMRVKYIIIVLGFVLLGLQSEGWAQRSQRRQQRLHDRTERKERQLRRDGKVDKEESADIDRKDARYERTKRRAYRNGEVSSHEHRKMKRQNRRYRREVKNAED